MSTISIRAGRFYEEVFEVAPLSADDRLRAYDIGGKSILLLFRRSGTLEDVDLAWWYHSTA